MQVCDSLAGSRGIAPLLLLPNFFFLKDLPPPTRSVFPPLSEANALKDLDCPPCPHSYWLRRSPGLRERSLKSLGWPPPLEEGEEGDNIRKFSREGTIFL